MLEQDWSAKALQTVTENLLELIRIPSFSREETCATDWLAAKMSSDGIAFERIQNNLIATNRHFDSAKGTILLNSHIDTVKPNAGYTRDPFGSALEEGKIIGLGSNDAGGALLCLYEVFKCFYDSENLSHNVIFAATAEEEISGKDGIELVLNQLGDIVFAIVGEPTEMKMAIAEKGLLVIDCTTSGKGGHAAHAATGNAIYHALEDLAWFKEFKFPSISGVLGPVLMNVTTINSGTQHNIIPALCKFTVDIRFHEGYTHETLLEIIRSHVTCEVIPRSTRLSPSFIPGDHKLIELAHSLGISTYGSPTLSDQALMPFDSVKMGPGKSERSHTADEFITIEELRDGLVIYKNLLTHALK
jgi:acetylornithine deacetylase